MKRRIAPRVRVRTPLEVRKDFDRRGVSVASWSKANSLHPQVVRDLLNGKSKGLRGQAHRAAVLLGIKDGVIEP